MRCTVCGEPGAEMDEEFGGRLCDLCYERIQDYPDAERGGVAGRAAGGLWRETAGG